MVYPAHFTSFSGPKQSSSRTLSSSFLSFLYTVSLYNILVLLYLCIVLKSVCICVYCIPMFVFNCLIFLWYSFFTYNYIAKIHSHRCVLLQSFWQPFNIHRVNEYIAVYSSSNHSLLKYHILNDFFFSGY